MPYLSSKQSTNTSQSRQTTPLKDVTVKKPLFKTPPWQKKNPFAQQDGAGSTTPTPTPRLSYPDGSTIHVAPDITETPKKNTTVKRNSFVSRNVDYSEFRPQALPPALKKCESEDSFSSEISGKSFRKVKSSQARTSQADSSVNSFVQSKRDRSNPAPKSDIQTPSSESSYRQYETVKTNDQTRSKTSSRPRIVVEIPPPPSQALLAKFRKPLPKSAVKTVKGITLKETDLIAELKQDVSVARSRASTVEEVFGSHGLSEYYDDTAIIEAKHKALAQPKAKKVKASKIKLDWGPVPQTARTFKPENIISPAGQAERLLDAKFQDIASGPPLRFVNIRNNKQIDGKFQFVDSYVHRNPPKKTQTISPDFGCSCSGECNPTDSSCRCSQTSGTKLVPYVKHPDGLVVLDPHFIDSFDGEPQEIFECNDACHCSQGCFNRVVQKGRTVPLQIFMTERCGFGIRSPKPIKKGQFIDTYLGELLTTKQIEEYENASSEKSSSYVFSLDFFSNQPTYHIQGLHFGSPTRFINHSCNPNARTFTVMMNHADQKIYKLAYFAIKDIPAMKEITFDYSPNEEKWIPTPGEEEEGVVRCLCGERNCRGRLWASKRQTARRGRGKGLARY